MKHELLFSGIGGQGVMVLGETLCAAAIEEGYNVTFAPFYGQEKRGGRTMCNIVIADSMESPIISEAGIMMVMDNRSFLDYESLMAPGGLMLVNSSMVDCEPTRTDYTLLRQDYYRLATEEIGNAKTANMVALGAISRQISYIRPESIQRCIERSFAHKPKLIPANLNAFRLGYML